MAVLRVAIITNVLPHYREAFYRGLFERPELRVTVYCQDAIPGMNLTTVHQNFPDNVQLVRAWVRSGERIGWQRLPWLKLLRNYDVLFVYANPRLLSSVLFASTARCLRRHVVLWGPARSAGATGLGARLRLAWWRAFRALFVYTDREGEWLRSRGLRRQHILGMNNGLDQRKIDAAALAWTPASLQAWRRREGVVDRVIILSCARLEPKNEFELCIKALPRILDRFPNALWCVVGDGREGPGLRKQAYDLGLERNIRWLGSILSEDLVAPWFLSSRLLVHPSAIGLTLLHAFGYGVPVVTHGDADDQMPEFAAFTAGKTGNTYSRNDASSLADAVCAILADPMRRDAMGATARRVAREQYNVSVMVDRFVSMATFMGAPR
jgi:glycosyltransferase involved in cell wall biosynthesis